MGMGPGQRAGDHHTHTHAHGAPPTPQPSPPAGPHSPWVSWLWPPPQDTSSGRAGRSRAWGPQGWVHSDPHAKNLQKNSFKFGKRMIVT